MTNPFTGKVLKPFMANKKTYIISFAIVVMGIFQALGIHVPDWAMWIAGGSGLAAHRASINGIASAVDDIGGMITEVSEATSDQVVSATSKVIAVTATNEYQNATETGKTDLLNQSQN